MKNLIKLFSPILFYVLTLGVAAYFLYKVYELKKNDRPNYSPEMSKILKQRDSLRVVIHASVTREQWYRDQLKKDSAWIVQIEEEQEVTEHKIKRYEIKLKEIDNLVIHNLDSFFIHWYPDSLRPREGHINRRLERRIDRQGHPSKTPFRYFNSPERYSVNSEAKGDISTKNIQRKSLEGNRRKRNSDKEFKFHTRRVRLRDYVASERIEEVQTAEGYCWQYWSDPTGTFNR